MQTRTRLHGQAAIFGSRTSATSSQTVVGGVAASVLDPTQTAVTAQWHPSPHTVRLSTTVAAPAVSGNAGVGTSQLFTHPQRHAWYDDNARGAGPRRGHATGQTVGCPAFLRQSCCSRLRRVARQRRETRIVPPTKEGATLVRGCLATSVICCSRHVSDKREARHTRQ